jgi:hypothetical protein
MDILWLGERILSLGKKPGNDLPAMNLSACDSCNKPDIFFIILDEYSGNTGLNHLFHFDNAEFENWNSVAFLCGKTKLQ